MVKKSFLQCEGSAFNFIKKETLAWVFFCEFGEIFKSPLFTEHIQAASSE